MSEIPQCLHKRYETLDRLVKDLKDSTMNSESDPVMCNDPAIKLMCDFWEILKENPDVDLKSVIEERTGLVNKPRPSGISPQEFLCYLSDFHKNCVHPKSPRANMSQHSSAKDGNKPCDPKKCTSMISKNTCDMMAGAGVTDQNLEPLSKVLCNLNEAVSFDKKCVEKIDHLMNAQRMLKEHIMRLEAKEREGTQMLEKADCMWNCMEQSYKNKILLAQNRADNLMKELNEADVSVSKWRKNLKDVELQFRGVKKCEDEVTEKFKQREDDIQYLNNEIETLKKRKESALTNANIATKSLAAKKEVFNNKVQAYNTKLGELQKQIVDTKKTKSEKEAEESKSVKEARDDLTRMCKLLLKKKLENEDLIAEKETLQQEIELIKQTCGQCKDRCKNKKKSMQDEIAEIDKQIAQFKVQCIRCHQYTDTSDSRRFCIDCPKCLEQRECILKDGTSCERDPAYDCVCMTIKQKFLDNVFENMSSVLEKKAKTRQGQKLAESVMKSLKKSKNGKLDADTRRNIKQFVVSIVRKNLNLTIVGGAVKTRCEMDPDTYCQLMNCLKSIRPTPSNNKSDRGVGARKGACSRWGGPSECNCPKGPKDCICKTRAPIPCTGEKPCPKSGTKEEVDFCPHHEEVPCGPDCGLFEAGQGSEYKTDPCNKGKKMKNMKAAQCILCKEPELGCSKGNIGTAPFIPYNDHSLKINLTGSSTNEKEQIKAVGALVPAVTQTIDKGTENDEDKVKLKKSPSGNLTVTLDEKNIDRLVLQVDSMRKLLSFRKTESGQLDFKFNSELSLLNNNLNSITKTDSGNLLIQVPQGTITADSDHFIKILTSESDSYKTDTSKNTRKTILKNGPKKKSEKLPVFNSESVKNVNIPSLKLAVSLDENVFEDFLKNSKVDSNISFCLKKTASGHFSVDLDSKSKPLFGRILQTDSGNACIQIQKSLFETVHPELAQSAVVSNQTVVISDDGKTSYNQLRISASGNLLLNLDDHMAEELKKKINNDTNDIAAAVKVTNSNRFIIEFVEKKHNMCDTRSMPQSNKTSVQQKIAKCLFDNAYSNTTYTEQFIKETMLQDNELPSFNKNFNGEDDNYYIVKVKLSNKINGDVYIVLKRTPSGNYTTIIDKEYYESLLKYFCNNVNNDKDCELKLKRKDSGYYVLDSKSDDKDCQIYNLTKTDSGAFNIVPKDSVPKLSNKISICNIGEADSSKNILDLSKENKVKIKISMHDMSQSDSRVYDTVRLTVNNSQGENKKFALIQKTPVGDNMSLIMTAEDKSSFITKLGDRPNKTEGYVPIKSTDSGAIKILLSEYNNDSVIGQLKLTESENIYLVFDKAIEIKQSVSTFNGQTSFADMSSLSSCPMLDDDISVNGDKNKSTTTIPEDNKSNWTNISGNNEPSCSHPFHNYFVSIHGGTPGLFNSLAEPTVSLSVSKNNVSVKTFIRVKSCRELEKIGNDNSLNEGSTNEQMLAKVESNKTITINKTVEQSHTHKNIDFMSCRESFKCMPLQLPEFLKGQLITW